MPGLPEIPDCPAPDESPVDERVWRRTLIVAWLGQVAAIMGFSFAMPLLPLFLGELGIDDEKTLRIWSGYISAGSALSMMTLAPVWGILADRFGKKLMVLRAMFAGAFIVAGMGLATTPWMLLAIRFLQGAFTGTVGASAALVASVTPPKRAGFSLGLMSTAVFVGHSIGPLVGGMTADAWGYRKTFFIGGGILLVAAFLILFLAKEGKAPSSPGPRPTVRQELGGLLGVIYTPGFAVVIFFALVMAFSRTVMAPIFSLYVKSFTGPTGVAGVAGRLFSVTAISTALVAIPMGWLTDRLGYKFFLVAGTILAGAACIPQAYVGSVSGIYGWRIIIGMGMGMSGPAMGRLLHRAVSPSSYGKAFGISQSASAMGWGLGSISGGYLGAWLGLRTPFVVTGIFQISVGVIALVVLSVLVRPDDASAPAGPTEGGSDGAGPPASGGST